MAAKVTSIMMKKKAASRIRLRLFKSDKTVNVDFDHVFVKTEKADATYSEHCIFQ